MSLNKDFFCLKTLFQDYFLSHDKLVIGKMYFRLYDPVNEHIVCHYSEEDWNLIFADTTEDDLKELASCCNVTILVWCEVDTDVPYGMIYFEDNIHNARRVSFHGGTWEHASRFHLEIFRSLSNLFDAIFSKDICIATTCGITNKRASKFQDCLGFVEIERDEQTIYKELCVEAYMNSKVVNKVRIHNFKIF